MIVETILAAASLAVSAFLTAFVRRIALSRGVLDVPNERSSHSAPTPRGGGLAIVLTTLSAWILLARLEILRWDIFVALAGGGVAVSLIGLMDDHRQLSARIRLLVHVAAAIWAIVWLGGLPPLQLGSETVSLGYAGYILGVVGIVWALNLFNFMDGVDGIAASEGVFVAWGGVLIALAGGVGVSTCGAALVLGAACGGFLLWNWPPAKIFMGDVGSGYLGYAIAVLALAAARESPPALLSWMILGGVFFVDATMTLARRLMRGERVHEAHRSHAYQWLARRWQSHRRVTVVVLLVDVLWVLPWALFASSYPGFAAWSVAAALLPLAGAVLVAGAGRGEKTPD